MKHAPRRTACLMAAGCNLAPTYHVPAMAVPAAFKETPDWKLARPDVRCGARDIAGAAALCQAGCPTISRW